MGDTGYLATPVVMGTTSHRAPVYSCGDNGIGYQSGIDQLISLDTDTMWCANANTTKGCHGYKVSIMGAGCDLITVPLRFSQKL